MIGTMERLPVSPSDECWYEPGGDWAMGDEDTEDVPTAPSEDGATGAWFAAPIREDGFMWDALMGGGAA